MTRQHSFGLALALTALVAVGCRGAEKAGTSTKVGAAALIVPTRWQPRLPRTETDRQVWSPTPAQNGAKETLAVRVAKRRTQRVWNDVGSRVGDLGGVLA